MAVGDKILTTVVSVHSAILLIDIASVTSMVCHSVSAMSRAVTIARVSLVQLKHDLFEVTDQKQFWIDMRR